MPEAVTLATLEAAALTQGITFLYGQATELLKRRRDRKDAAVDDGSPASPPRPVDEPILAGKLVPVEVDEQVIESRSEEFLRTYRAAQFLRERYSGGRSVQCRVDRPGGGLARTSGASVSPTDHVRW